jgi:hypothetical protein
LQCGGTVGAKWITNEADKSLLKESVKVAGTKEKMSAEQAEAISRDYAQRILGEIMVIFKPFVPFL